MNLLYGVLCLCFTALLFSITLLGVRNPVRPLWAKEDIFANVLVPLIVSFFALGIAFFAQAIMADSLPGWLEWSYAALAALVTLAGIKMLDIRRKLTAFSSQESKRAEIIAFETKGDGHPEKPTFDTSDFRKAA